MTAPRVSLVVRSVALVFAVMLPSAAHADGPLAALVKDIVAGGSPSFPGTAGPTEGNAVVINDVMFFTATTVTSGTELWKSDGTAAGTVLVKDIAPGPPPSFPLSLTNVNGTLFFYANDGSLGFELWKSDGTAMGTVLVKDIVAGPGSSIVSAMVLDRVVKAGVLYFVALDLTHGVELWRSDGTDAGTFMVKDISLGVPSGLVPANNWLVNVNGTLFFSATDGVAGVELWASDGTAGGTTLVGDIAPGILNASPSNLTDVNGALMFMASNGTTVSLWRSDGTTANTQPVANVPFFNGCRIVFGGLLYFAGSQAATGGELWKSDGTAAGTVLVKDILPGASSSAPCRFTAVDDTLFFAAESPGQGNELWKTDGTPVGTVLVKDILPGPAGSFPGGMGPGSPGMLAVNGTLVFVASGATGIELWKSDGTAAGSVMMHDFPASGAPTILGKVGGHVLFAANDSDTGRELWKTLPTRSDFDGDGRADVVVYRPTAGQWWINRSVRNFTTALMVPWGLATDLPAVADFDGDGKMDPAVFRPTAGGVSPWFVRQSLTGYASAYAVVWGTLGDVPVPGYYNADRFADVAVYRPSTGQWLISHTGTGSSVAIEWGVAGDVPVPADYDGDRRTDIAVYRPSTGQWLVKLSKSDFLSVFVLQWGVPALNDIPVPGDYDGDGKADPAVYRPGSGHWLAARSSTGYATPLVVLWGSQASNDQPVPIDVDGDGRTDPAIYRPGTGQWFLLESRSNHTTYTVALWGNQALGDLPVREK